MANGVSDPATGSETLVDPPDGPRQAPPVPPDPPSARWRTAVFLLGALVLVGAGTVAATFGDQDAPIRLVALSVSSTDDPDTTSEPADGDGVDDAGSDADTTGSADSSLDEAVRVESPPADGADAGTVLDIPGLDESGIDLADLQAGADKLDAADEDDVVILSLPTGEPVDVGDLQPLTATIRGDNVFLEGTAPSVEVALAYEEQARVIWGDQVVPRYSIDERAPDPQADDVKLEKPVLFEPGSSTIDPEYLPVLDACFEFLTAFPEVTMIVEGHTDDVGSEEYNLRLAEERAEAIVSYYESLGLDRDRLVTVAAGEASPLADNGTEEGREQNRRIDLSLVGALLDATNGVDANGVDADDETDDPTGSDDS